MIDSAEVFMKKAEWRLQKFLHPEKFITKETYKFNSLKNPPKAPELKAFRRDFLNSIRNIEFVEKHNPFQNKLKEEIDQINDNANVIIAADKTSNHYEMPKHEYVNFVKKAVHKEYKKESVTNVNKVNTAHKNIVRKLDINDRVFRTVEKESFVTMKDHKPDFQNAPKTRLLSSTKCEVGRISHIILSKIVKVVREKSKLNQWKNIYECINWYNIIPNKSNMTFIVFDIVDFYPSISKELLVKALNWARKFVPISESDEDIIMQSRKPLLYHEGSFWTKKSNPDFDVAMGSFDSAEICDLCGLFILAELENLKLNAVFGSYKDDGLALTRASARQTDIIKKKICVLFQGLGLKITIEANKRKVQFLDAEFDLSMGTYRPFIKPGDTPLYVHSQSNHPPSILKNIPESIQKRLSSLSSNEDIFNEVSPIYQEALNKAGYSFILRYVPPSSEVRTKKRTRKREVIWWNPPYSMNVKTKVGENFFKILRLHFPKGHPLYKLFNQNTVKMSYRTTPNMKNVISKHNARILSNREPDLPCNCTRKGAICPLDGQCRYKNIIYQAKVTHEDQTIPDEFYIGMTSTTFKERLGNHNKSFNHEEHEKETALSKYIWKLKRQKVKYSIAWRVIDRAQPFNPVRGTCPLCTLEKYYIIYKPSLATINQHEEIFKPCMHREKQLLDNT